MQRSNKVFLGLTLVALALIAAIFYLYPIDTTPSSPASSPAAAGSAQFPPAGELLIGGDRDEHGCIGSAGYQWCEARKECIRAWETYCTATPPKTVTFTCENSKSIKASFYIGDDRFVDLELSDGRKMSIPHALSASGARYAKADESFIFWNKGDTAFITEGDFDDVTYSGCVEEGE
ncbi:hypothetical protein A3C18_00650 [Candidatus Kaiserbacteria bacterium RIFCSPHIGHO2_02_FULL_54_11b]|uniref:C-type lysozyme inhibitor domain-containing protein n=2 Tax=Candidatus Kaiseribacteriota TaxID=1752734 RepID=A0A1F6CMA8_9BACT|nr:MAG: hypothetical protein A2704_05470 [Candidatus Kaiserbacteria bacterium RIFCSPHIGHO2_01_FULL_54_36b]OGG64753.1 MAG: hypothetical protein A3C18_00650 [Candidatus Kaiserbacteria bacterium RIFCSPHIGHO2_02_FULL_54_11b]